jgi:hypothetical protein
MQLTFMNWDLLMRVATHMAVVPAKLYRRFSTPFVIHQGEQHLIESLDTQRLCVVSNCKRLLPLLQVGGRQQREQLVIVAAHSGSAVGVYSLYIPAGSVCSRIEGSGCTAMHSRCIPVHSSASTVVRSSSCSRGTAANSAAVAIGRAAATVAVSEAAASARR